ncbi:hypothetical protein EYR38_008693 [Pleurotus pulmonarius]|nr:hypothetical protein EYR38_008693 [Pleurotus pulmonarius]
MFLFALPSLLIAIRAMSLFTVVRAAPVNETDRFDGMSPEARSILARATPAAPHFVLYSDMWVSGQTRPPTSSQLAGVNTFILSFLLTVGAWDQAQAWQSLDASQRSSIKAEYAAAGIKLMVSAFGATDAPTSVGLDPVATANTMAAWVKQYGLDGIDVDYEDFNAINAGDGKAEAWLTSFTKQLRVQLPQGTYILTHAPVAPWFSPNKFGGGAYLTVNKNVGSLIDWYNVQFYNQGSSEYTTCNNLLSASSSTWPKSSVFEIAASGIPLSKIVIGKPAAAGDANNGFMSTSTLASCLSQAKNQGWNGGVMVWQGNARSVYQTLRPCETLSPEELSSFPEPNRTGERKPSTDHFGSFGSFISRVFAATGTSIKPIIRRSLSIDNALFKMLFAISRTVVVFLVLGALSFVTSAPTSNSTSLDLSTEARNVLSRAVPAPPHFLIYSDQPVSGELGPPPVSEIAGFNVFALAFLLVDGAFDKAKEWTRLSPAQRAKVKAEYAAAGIKLIVSVFGATDAPTTNGADPVKTANEMADWVKEFDLDGIDVDYEDFDAVNAGDGKAEAWVIAFTRQLRVRLPQGQFILTHAPVAPWFSPNKFGGGAYVTINKAVGHLIDWYNLQFYNQGDTEYTTCEGLLFSSSQTWPKSALFQIASSGIPFSKLVIGKPATSDDASNGFMTTSELATCVQEAKRLGWGAGVMVWEFPNADDSWIRSVRSKAFPV